MLTFWNSLTIKDREELVKNLNAYHGSVASLVGRKIVSLNKLATEITVLKKCLEVKELEALLKKINVPGIKLIYPKTNPTS